MAFANEPDNRMYIFKHDPTILIATTSLLTIGLFHQKIIKSTGVYYSGSSFWFKLLV